MTTDTFDDRTPEEIEREELARLKEEIADLRDLLRASTGWLVLLKKALVRSPFTDTEFEEVTKLQDRIDGKLSR